MRNGEQHLSDEDLLLAAEGEPEKRVHAARAHLAACARCRNRAAQLESVLFDLARARKSSAELPSIAGPRAVLRTRLAELSSGKTSVLSLLRFADGFFTRAFGVAALASVMVLACIPALRRAMVSSGPLSLLSPDRRVLPNRAFTPGAARPVSLDQVCSLPHEEVITAVSPAERARVFAEYGISSAQSDQYEVDYLITPGLGGYDDLRNLWPEPYKPTQWNAHVKDALEERLHQMVCSHQLDLSVAQQAIATNWISAYEKYVPAAPSGARAAKASLLLKIVSSIVIGRSMR